MVVDCGEATETPWGTQGTYLFGRSEHYVSQYVIYNDLISKTLEIQIAYGYKYTVAYIDTWSQVKPLTHQLLVCEICFSPASAWVNVVFRLLPAHSWPSGHLFPDWSSWLSITGAWNKTLLNSGETEGGRVGALFSSLSLFTTRGSYSNSNVSTRFKAFHGKTHCLLLKQCHDPGSDYYWGMHMICSKSSGAISKNIIHGQLLQCEKAGE